MNLGTLKSDDDRQFTLESLHFIGALKKLYYVMDTIWVSTYVEFYHHVELFRYEIVELSLLFCSQGEYVMHS